MASYQGRKGPNVSNYLANLNAIPSSHDVSPDENFKFDEELAQFTNTEFFDFDTGNLLEQNVPEYNSEEEKKVKGGIDGKGIDYVNGAFPFGDINPYLPQDGQQTPQYPYNAAPNTLYNPTPPSPAPFSTTPYPGQKRPHSSSTTTTTGVNSPTPSTTTAADPPPLETAASRLAAEEDKRRRNTAASARFRVKKKQREQALEATAKELENKTTALEQRIGQLETENEWLRGLVVEKHGGAKEDLRLRFREGKGEGERSMGRGKKGVGTGGEGSEE